jgi:hypothetical protein
MQEQLDAQAAAYAEQQKKVMLFFKTSNKSSVWTACK